MLLCVNVSHDSSHTAHHHAQPHTAPHHRPSPPSQSTCRPTAQSTAVRRGDVAWGVQREGAADCEPGQRVWIHHKWVRIPTTTARSLHSHERESKTTGSLLPLAPPCPTWPMYTAGYLFPLVFHENTSFELIVVTPYGTMSHCNHVMWPQ
jgi:hypothetical protein